MIIPREEPYRTDKIIEIRDACLVSRGERQELYLKRRKYFMFGSDDYRQVRYNRLAAHTDLVASFLFSPDHAKYTLAPARNAPPAVEAQALALQDRWNQEFRDSGLAYQYAIAVLWSLIYDSMYLKLGWNDERSRLTGRLIQPNHFGVYDEREPDLDSQQAFCHVYRIPYDNAVLRLYRAGMADQVKELGVSTGTNVEDMPPVLKQLLITQTGGQNLSGNLMGQAPLDIQPVILYEPKSDIPTVEFQDLYVWDDVHEDYAQFIIAEPDLLLTDSRESIAKRKEKKLNGKNPIEQPSASNEFLPQEHPFVAVTPFELPDYAYGEAHSERLIPLQNWTTERLDQIAEILEAQVDPSKVISGFMGLADEKAAAFGGPGSWVLDALPGAKVEKQYPQMPEDLFTEFNEIGEIFLEASGLTQTVTGQAPAAGRGGRGAQRQPVMTGSGRIRKIALGLEPSLVQLGDLALKLIRRNDDEELLLPDGKSKFLPAQFASETWNLRIAGHSHSPLFADEARELAALLFKAQAIDREMLVRLLSPPQEDSIISALRERVKVEALQAQLNPPGAQRPGGGRRGEAHGPTQRPA